MPHRCRCGERGVLAQSVHQQRRVGRHLRGRHPVGSSTQRDGVLEHALRAREGGHVVARLVGVAVAAAASVPSLVLQLRRVLSHADGQLAALRVPSPEPPRAVQLVNFSIEHVRRAQVAQRRVAHLRVEPDVVPARALARRLRQRQRQVLLEARAGVVL